MELLDLGRVGWGRLLGRVSRFTVALEAEGGVRRCHLHDPGRLKHLLREGVRVYFREAWRPGRRTDCDVVAVECCGRLILEDTRLGNRLFPHAAGLVVPGLSGWLASERWVNGFRVDFVSSSADGRPVLVEVKTTNLVEDGVALFPDAPSRRASRQVEALATAARAAGVRSVVVFTVLRSDAKALRPNRRVDPRLARLLCSHQSVLELYAYRVEARLEDGRLKVYYAGTIPVEPCS